MVIYKNEEYLKHEIMDQSRHQFIYGYNGIHRTEFLKDMASEYPIMVDENSPMAIYVSEYGLPKIPISNDEIDKIKLNIISREFLFSAIASDILLNSKKNNDLDLLNQRMKKLINILNQYSLNKDYPSIKDIDGLIELLLQTKEFYKQYYLECCSSNDTTLSIDDIAMPFLQFDTFVRKVKSALANNSYFGIIIDKKDDIAITSTCAINFLVGGRINKDVSMKIVTQPDDWDLYTDFNGQVIENVHDYGIVELDDSLTCSLKRVKK